MARDPKPNKERAPLARGAEQKETTAPNSIPLTDRLSDRFRNDPKKKRALGQILNTLRSDYFLPGEVASFFDEANEGQPAAHFRDCIRRAQMGKLRPGETVALVGMEAGLAADVDGHTLFFIETDDEPKGLHITAYLVAVDFEVSTSLKAGAMFARLTWVDPAFEALEQHAPARGTRRTLLTGARGPIPSPEQMDADRRDLERARAMLNLVLDAVCDPAGWRPLIPNDQPLLGYFSAVPNDSHS